MKPKDKILPPIHANAGIEAEYAKKLQALIDEMHRSVAWFIVAAYRKNIPLIAQDELPSAALKRAVDALASRWIGRFDEASKALAKYFALSVAKRSDARLRTILKNSGFAVEFKMTRGMQDIARATINANVALIKSIPQKYLGDVEGMVMRSVQTGHDLAQLSQDLHRAYAITRKRAVLIAKDQNFKATAFFNRARQTELGIEEGEWHHSHAGKEPRPSHVAAGARKQRYKIAEGWFDPDADGIGRGRYIIPGELINCRCSSRSIIPGFI